MQVPSIFKAKVERPSRARRVLARSWRNSGEGTAGCFHRGNLWTPLVTLVLQPGTPGVFYPSSERCYE